MINVKVLHVYRDCFFEANLIRIIKDEFDTNVVNIKWHLEKSKDPFRCPDSVWITITKNVLAGRDFDPLKNSN